MTKVMSHMCASPFFPYNRNKYIYIVHTKHKPTRDPLSTNTESRVGSRVTCQTTGTYPGPHLGLGFRAGLKIFIYPRPYEGPTQVQDRSKIFVTYPESG